MRLFVAGPTGVDDHDGGVHHPERQGRIFAAMDGVRSLHLDDDIEYLEVAPAPMEALERVHDTSYLRGLESFCADGGGDLDPDTFARRDSWLAARRAAGAGLAAIEALQEAGDGVAFIPVRPPGHHALGDRAMGFCLLNNIAVAAAALTASDERVLIIDWDVHHGNGTQSIFWEDPRVLFVSSHQFPWYPGTGTASEVGGIDARGLTVNVPLPAGATGDVVLGAFDSVAGPVVASFAPTWVLVSCGFDAHRADPLGELALSAGDFAALARLVKEFVPATGHLALFLEGGYDAAALKASVAATLGALIGTDAVVEPTTSGGPGREHVLAAARIRRQALEVAG